MAVGNAKIILSGEHAVLGGVRALVMPYAQGVIAVRDPAMGQWQVNGHYRPELAVPFAALCGALKAEGGGHATLGVPAGVGLGVSAALGVAIARALAPSAAPAHIQAAATAWEHCLHGHASGVDVAAAMADGPLLFQMGAAPVLVRSTPIDAWLLPVVVEPAPPTAQMVTQVQAWAAEHAREWQAFCDASDSRSLEMQSALVDGDGMRLGASMVQAHAGLQRVGIATPGATLAVERFVAAGAWGAKTTGAGGGGVVVALVPTSALEAVQEAGRRAGAMVLAAIPVGGTPI